MFFSNYDKLCKEIGMSANSVAKKLGISSGTVTGWKRGAAPKSDTLKAISEYFNVSTDYLLGISDIKNKPTTDNSDELSPDEAEFMAIFRQLSPEHKRELMDYALYKADK